jgi:hypothetical protein
MPLRPLAAEQVVCARRRRSAGQLFVRFNVLEVAARSGVRIRWELEFSRDSACLV